MNHEKCGAQHRLSLLFWETNVQIGKYFRILFVFNPIASNNKPMLLAQKTMAISLENKMPSKITPKTHSTVSFLCSGDCFLPHGKFQSDWSRSTHPSVWFFLRVLSERSSRAHLFGETKLLRTFTLAIGSTCVKWGMWFPHIARRDIFVIFLHSFPQSRVNGKTLTACMFPKMSREKGNM